MNDQPNRHRFTARPVDPELERAATERAVQAAEESARAAAWIDAHSGPATSGNAPTLNDPGEKFTPGVNGPAGLRDRVDAAIGQALDDDPMHTLTDLQQRLTTTVCAELQPELDALAALRQVARGYCPHCGRGDAAPTVDDWEQQKQRADHAETERDTARQHAATIAAQRDRLRQRMNTLADQWDHALAPDKAYARTLRAEITCAPFDPEGAMKIQEYTERGRRLWAFRCWGTDTCEGWLGLGHHTQTSALLERERHVAEAHEEAALDDPTAGPTATHATDQPKEN